MIRPCSKTLKELRKIAKTTDTALSFMGDMPYICQYNDTSIYFDYSNFRYSGEIHATINELVRTGHLAWVFEGSTFTLTSKGLHPYLVGWDAFKNFLFTSVAIPIVVSTITALITLWLRGLL